MSTRFLTLVCALNCEAKPWIEFYKLKKECDRPFDLYSSSECSVQVLISGIGALSTATAIGWLGARMQLRGSLESMAWLNLGIAGHANLDLAKPVRVHAFVGEENLRKHYPPMVAKWAGESSALLSVNAPSDAYPDDMMVDMEAFAFYQSACMFSSAELVQSIKVISDNREHDVSELNAAKITALMRQPMNDINKFIDSMLALPQANIPPDVITELLQVRATHSQRQQLDALLKKVSVLSLHDQLASLDLESKSNIKDVLEALRSLLSKAAPSLNAKDHQSNQIERTKPSVSNG